MLMTLKTMSPEPQVAALVRSDSANTAHVQAARSLDSVAVL